jgi:hypothetical protein
VNDNEIIIFEKSQFSDEENLTDKNKTKLAESYCDMLGTDILGHKQDILEALYKEKKEGLQLIQ